MHESRTVDACPYRKELAGDDDVAFCQLVREVTGVADQELCRVEREACECCCRWFPPSAAHPNPVVASLLYQVATRVLREGDVPGCNQAEAESLRAFATANLPSDEESRHVEQPGEAEIVLPTVGRRSGARVQTWAVGVTTAPRSVPTLERCLQSLVEAGWPRPRLFVDGDVALPRGFADLPRTHRDPQMGAWPNYYLALGELLMRHPRADAYMLVQDDTLFCQGVCVRDYLERALWPGPTPGLVSLFSPRSPENAAAAWHAYRRVWNHCALAFIFPRHVAQQFLASSDVVLHRVRHGLANIPWRVGRWAVEAGVSFHYPAPSLVQHIGHVSTLWSHLRAFGHRHASWFAGR
jgi:hypothetical protein